MGPPVSTDMGLFATHCASYIASLAAFRVADPLTRARQGMVILVPEGDAADPTRSPDFYDPTWQFLRGVGLPDVGRVDYDSRMEAR